MDTIHERRSFCLIHQEFLKPDGTCPADLPTPESIRTLLAGKQYFDNDYSPADWLSCQCNRPDCSPCLSRHASADCGSSTAEPKMTTA